MFQELQISAFTAGELSPRMKGRTDYAKYYEGVDTELNMVTMPQGGATRRPGTMFVAKAKDQNPAPFSVRLLPFVFSTVQAYAVELGGGYARIYADDGQVLDGPSPVEIAVPYATADLRHVKRTQSNDELFLTCGKGGDQGNGFPPATLNRLSQTNWTYTPLTLLDGPYGSLNTIPQTTIAINGLLIMAITAVVNAGGGLIKLTVADTSGLATGQNVAVGQVQGTVEANGQWVITVVDGTHVTLQASAFANTYVSGGVLTALNGDVTFVASQTDGINKGAGFQNSDVGRQIRVLSSDGVTTGWIWAIITSVGNSTHCTATVQPATITTQNVPQGPNPTSQWQMGEFTDTLGYPYLASFWQERLAFAGTNDLPSASWQSNTGAFTTFGPSNADGTVVASNGILYVIADDQVNPIRWFSVAGSAEAPQLGIGTAGAEQIMQASATTQALGAGNVQAYRETNYGSAEGPEALRIGKAVLFVDASGRKLREWAFYWQVNGYLGPDKTQESEHITRGPQGSDPAGWGIRWQCYQQAPYQIIWAGLNNGALISFTYDRDQQIWAPARHRLGGDYYGAAPWVEDGAVIPSPDGTYSELWLCVLRTIAGVPTRTIEVMTRYFDALPQEQAWFVDCAAASALNKPSTTMTPPPTLIPQPPAAGTLAQTMPPAFTGTGVFSTAADTFAATAADIGKVIRINGGKAVITAPIDARNATARVVLPLLGLAPAASGAWSLDTPDTSFSGLGWLNGETVSVLADGADAGRQTLSGGTVHLANKATYAIAGLPYTPVLLTMPFEAQRATLALSRGRAKRASHLYLRLHETIGCAYGRRMTDPGTNQVEDALEALEFRLPGDPLNQAPPLYTGIRRLDLSGGFDRECQVMVTQDGPFPLTVLSLNASVDTGEQPVVQQQ